MRRVRIIVSFMVFLFCVFSFYYCPASADAAYFSGGIGTQDDPYIVATAGQLDSVRDDLTAHYKLSGDIDLTAYLAAGGAGYAKWGAEGWNPIGTYSPVVPGADDPFFNGSFDGDGYKITGLWINRSTDYVGLFGAVNDVAWVRNLGVEISGGVKGQDYVGGLAGWLSNYVADSVITNCYVIGDVSGNDYVGGLIGGGQRWNNSNMWAVEDCYTSSDITGRDWVGGLIGASVGDVSGSGASGNVSGRGRIGGLIGTAAGNVSDSRASGNVISSSGNYAGGLVGDLAGDISDSSAAGNVSGGSYVGGLSGHQNGNLSDCFATGLVSGDNYAGGLTGSSAGSATGSYATGSVNGRNYVGGLAGYLGSGAADSSATGSVSGRDYVGGLAGNLGGGLSGCFATGEVSGDNYTGGLAGMAGGGAAGSYATGSVKGRDYVGGLTGHQGEGMSYCFATGDVSGGNYVGGLAGRAGDGVTGSYATGRVTARDYTGGLTGEVINGVSYSYATGSVSGDNYVGGITGNAYNVAPNTSILLLANCLATGNVSGSGIVGGLSGVNATTGANGEHSHSNNYRYQFATVNGDTIEDGNLTSKNGGVVTAAHLLTEVFYRETLGWTFGGAEWVWDDRGFPKLGMGGAAEGYPFPFAGAPDLCTVTFDSRGGSPIAPIVDAQPGAIVARPVNDPYRSGYEFTGWYRDYSATAPWNFSADKLTGDLTLYAGWRAHSTVLPVHTVTFDSQGGSETAPIIVLQHGTMIARPAAPVREGYTFTGWYRDAAAAQPWSFDFDTVTGSITLYAGWRANAPGDPTYTAAFDSRGGSVVASVTGLASGAVIARPADPVRTGYTFAGWYRDTAATLAWDFYSDVVTGNVTLYAGWRADSGGGFFTVTFDSRGGSAVAPITGVLSGAKVTPPAYPTRAGFAFAGWYTDADAAHYWNFNTDVVTGDITLYAWWLENSSGGTTFTVTFDSRGGSAVAPITGLLAGAKIAQPGYPARAGFSFSGWYTDAAMTQLWNFGSDVVTGDLTLYAKWTSSGGGNVNTGGGGGCSALPMSVLAVFAALPLFVFKKRV